MTKNVKDIAETTKNGSNQIKSKFNAGSKTVGFWMDIIE